MAKIRMKKTDQQNPPYHLFCLGDQAVTFSLGDSIMLDANIKVTAMKEWLNQNLFDGLLDIVTAYNSITIVYDSYRVTQSGVPSPSAFVKNILVKAFQQSANGKSQTQKRY